MSYSKPYRMYNGIRNSLLGYHNRIGYGKGYSKGHRIPLRNNPRQAWATPPRELWPKLIIPGPLGR